MPAIGMMLSGAHAGASPGGGHYWRVLGNKEGNVALTALMFKDGTGASISASGGSAIESSHSSTFDSSKLFDATDATFWEATGAVWASWAGYQFATAKAVRQIALQKTASMDGSSAPSEVFVQYSENGTSWATVAHIIVGTLTNDVPTWYDLGPVFQEFPRTDFGSHTYWKMQDIQANGGTWTALSAMLFKDDGGSAIATTGGSAFESGHFSSFSASNLFDSNNSTFWESSGIGASSYAGYQFATAKKVMQIALQRTASMDGSNPPVFCRFEFSDDGIVWGIAADVVVGSLTNDVPTYFNLANAL